MDKFLHYFEDKKFVRWVLQPDENLTRFWEHYIRENPSEEEDIRLARMLVSNLQTKSDRQNVSESMELFSGIIARLEEHRRKIKYRRAFYSFMKYAAVGILFFALGMAYFYFQKSDPLDQISEQLALSGEETDARLILGGGENVVITEKESSVEYRADGKIVINNLDTVTSEINSGRPELNQLVIPYGKNSSVKLPDGTIAWLNAGSRLIYPSFFNGKKREVYLVGEGYFEVARNESMPFVVQTHELDVEVLGTKFNISAYPSDQIIETVLVEGKVRLSERGFQIKRNELIIEPDQLAVFDRSSAEIKVRQVDVHNYVDWHNGYLNFESTDMSRIVKKLERYYNIRIMLEDPMLGIRSISGKILLKEEKEKVLAVLANTANAKYVKLNENTYVIR